MCTHIEGPAYFQGPPVFFQGVSAGGDHFKQGSHHTKTDVVFSFLFPDPEANCHQCSGRPGLLFPFTTEGTVQIHDQIISDFPDSSFATHYHLHMIEQSFFLKAPYISHLQNLYKYLYLDLPSV